MNNLTRQRIEAAIPFLMGHSRTLPLPIRHGFSLNVNQLYQWALNIQDCCSEIEPATAVIATPFFSR